MRILSFTCPLHYLRPTLEGIQKKTDFSEKHIMKLFYSKTLKIWIYFYLEGEKSIELNVRLWF